MSLQFAFCTVFAFSFEIVFLLSPRPLCLVFQVIAHLPDALFHYTFNCLEDFYMLWLRVSAK